MQSPYRLREFELEEAVEEWNRLLDAVERRIPFDHGDPTDTESEPLRLLTSEDLEDTETL